MTAPARQHTRVMFVNHTHDLEDNINEALKSGEWRLLQVMKADYSAMSQRCIVILVKG